MRCDACGIDISGKHATCPLCGSTLSGTPSPSPFPPSTLPKSSRRIRIILGGITFVSIIAATVSCIITGISAGTALAIDAGLALNYLFVRNIVLHSPSAFRSIVRYFLIVIAFAYIWYIATRSQYTIDYIIPAASIISLVFDSVLIMLLSHQFVGPYSKYVLFNIVIGFLPLVFLGAHLLDNPVLSTISGLASIVTGTILWTFTKGQIKDELKRLLHH